jgi:hypothetical protein
MNTFQRYFWGGLGYWLFVICVIVSGIAGMFGGRALASWVLPLGHFSWVLAFQPVVSILSFFLLYRFVALSVVAVVEDKKGIELEKPSIKSGMIYSAIFPLVLFVIFLVLLFFGTITGSMHDSL